MLDHNVVFKISKKDQEWVADLESTGQHLPDGFFVDTIEKGVWAAAYAGWILGRYGMDEFKKRHKRWRELS